MKKLFNISDLYEDFVSYISHSSPSEDYKKGSFRFVANPYIFSCKGQKLIFGDFIIDYPEFQNMLDIAIYSDHWFRLPLSIKSQDNKGIYN